MKKSMLSSLITVLFVIVLVTQVCSCSYFSQLFYKETTTSQIVQTPVQQAPALTVKQAEKILADHLTNMAESSYAKQVFADFIDTFNQGETFMVIGESKRVEDYTNSQVSSGDFNYWEFAFFQLSRGPEGQNHNLPELFNEILTPHNEIIHSYSDGTTDRETTIALRWLVDSHTGQVKTTHPNALRLEAELLK